MKHLFRTRGFVTVPDGTQVSPFLNATDATQAELPWGSLGDMSISAGRIGPKVHSLLSVLPRRTTRTDRHRVVCVQRIGWNTIRPYNGDLESGFGGELWPTVKR